MSSPATTLARPGQVLADSILRAGASTAARARTRDLALVVGGAALTGLAAQISVPVPGTPVPVTGQTFAVLLVGTALGARRGLAAMALYLLAGAAGMPWFAEGASGFAMPSFGFVLGFVLAAAAVGALARRGGDRTPLRTAGTMLVGNAVIYAVGVPYLAYALQVPLAEAAALGMVPFLIGDALKLLLAAGVLPAAWKLVGRRG
ncbi:biotin transporter BioY [Allostreptomyces psammosilenae]|uniref:Biotin transporter n=1 Tax=Allostreptomyces psammosilenae TaxID=1892865 RepID=A0A853A2N1_9ACTN|nr:biotin transporter BioY [Allostreptomyces psammosilenae]NYI08387.1 biotin transport system substrate-specific component [Allostreptomyces psammosilenae]